MIARRGETELSVGQRRMTGMCLHEAYEKGDDVEAEGSQVKHDEQPQSASDQIERFVQTVVYITSARWRWLW